MTRSEVERYRAADGASLAYTRAGEGEPTLLLVHGWQATRAVWDPLARRLDRRFRPLAVDLRGMGASNAAPGPYTVEQFASDLGDLLDRLAPAPVVAVGHSMGGAVVQRLAVDRPSLRGIVLVASVPAQSLSFPPELEAFFRATFADTATKTRWLRGLTTAPQPPEITDLLLEAAATVPREVARASYESWTSLDFQHEVAGIRTPALVVAPSGDRPMTPALARERVADLITASRFEVLEDCRHYAQLDRPEALAQLITGFVDEL
jgi:pimeloyl-ACP methyl ester carboxylesterase